MLEIASSDLQSFPFDHHGLIASVCKDLKIAERIDTRPGMGTRLL